MPDHHTPQALSPEESEKLFNSGCRHHSEGRIDEALEIYLRLLSYYPEAALLHYNMGLALFDKQEHETAADSFCKALQYTPEDVDSHMNLALCYRRCGKKKEAAETLTRLLELSPTDVDGQYTLALTLQELDKTEAAIDHYRAVLEQSPDHKSSLNNLAYLLHKGEENEAAAEFYRRLLAINPEHSAAAHMLAAVSGETPGSVPSDYVEAVFDNYNDYETSLVEKLQCRIPEKLVHHYLSFTGEKRQNGDCLDLGCGTGLAGVGFAPYCGSLCGVDLSASMLESAKQKEVYDRLVKSEIVDFLLEEKSNWDLFIAADVFTYLGELGPIFDACRKRASDSSLLLFTVESLPENNGYKLMSTGRIAHSKNYIKTAAEENGWQVARIIDTSLRKEKKDWIKGNIFIMTTRENTVSDITYSA